jgi:hypothetical protein
MRLGGQYIGRAVRKAHIVSLPKLPRTADSGSETSTERRLCVCLGGEGWMSTALISNSNLAMYMAVCPFLSVLYCPVQWQRTYGTRTPGCHTGNVCLTTRCCTTGDILGWHRRAWRLYDHSSSACHGNARVNVTGPCHRSSGYLSVSKCVGGGCVPSNSSPCGIWAGQIGTETDFSPRSSVSSYIYHYTSVPL